METRNTDLRLLKIRKEGNEDGGDIGLGFWSGNRFGEEDGASDPSVQRVVMWEAQFCGHGVAGVGPPYIQSQKLFLINRYKSFSLLFLEVTNWLLIY